MIAPFGSFLRQRHRRPVAVHTIIQKLEGVCCIGANAAAWFLERGYVAKRRLGRPARPGQQAARSHPEYRETQMPVRILVVDDYQVARKTIRSLLTWHSMHVCGEAENGKQAIEKVKKLHPDLVLLDINMPVMNGVQAAYEIRQIAPSTKIIFLNIHDSPEAIAAGRTIGADAFVPKSAAGTDLIPAVQRLLKIT
jgi:CheY-like chemotaxis protein